MRRGVATVGLLAALAGCGGRGRSNPSALYLTLVHQPLAGELSTASDQRLLALGRQACQQMDSGAAADQVVAGIGGNPEPGSAAFNAYSFVAVAAADYLCPAHKSVFSGSVAGSEG